MKTDKELLQLAAKAVGIDLKYNWLGNRDARQPWDPLIDDGDTLRMAVDLDMDVCLSPRDKEVTAFTLSFGAVSNCAEPYGNDKHAATRRAIVRAAAAIGEDME